MSDMEDAEARREQIALLRYGLNHRRFAFAQRASCG